MWHSCDKCPHNPKCFQTCSSRFSCPLVSPSLLRCCQKSGDRAAVKAHAPSAPLPTETKRTSNIDATEESSTPRSSFLSAEPYTHNPNHNHNHNRTNIPKPRPFVTYTTAFVPKHETAIYEKYLQESVIDTSVKRYTSPSLDVVITIHLEQITATHGKDYPHAHKWSVVFKNEMGMYIAWALVYFDNAAPLDWQMVGQSARHSTRHEALMEETMCAFASLNY